jgi:hypothetical protein
MNQATTKRDGNLAWLRGHVSALRASVVGVLAAGALLAAAPQPVDAATAHGCASGYVCVYPQNAGWNGDRPSLRFYTYGAHNLSNQFGTHRVFNNQFSRAWASLCSGYNGTGTSLFLLGAGYATDFNLTPVNSIKLSPGITTGGC